MAEYPKCWFCKCKRQTVIVTRLAPRITTYFVKCLGCSSRGPVMLSEKSALRAWRKGVQRATDVTKRRDGENPNAM